MNNKLAIDFYRHESVKKKNILKKKIHLYNGDEFFIIETHLNKYLYNKMKYQCM